MSLSPSVDLEAQPAIEQSRLRQSFVRKLKRWLREPLVHFLFIGIVVFAVYAYMHRGRGGVESSRQIVLNLDELRQMDMYFASRGPRRPISARLYLVTFDNGQGRALYRVSELILCKNHKEQLTL